MRRNERTTALDGFPAVGLKSVGGIVEVNAENEFEEEVGHAVDHEFYPRIINNTAAFDEAAAENAIVALVQFLPIAHNVPAVVRFIGHHNDDGIARHMVQPANDGAPEP